MYINCEYCGKQFNSKLGKCPSCGAEVASNTKINEQKALDKNIAKEIKQAHDEASKLKWEELERTHPSPKRSESIKSAVVVLIILVLMFGFLFFTVFSLISRMMPAT